MIYRTYYLSPLGRILLAADDIGLIGVWFEGQKYFGEFPGHMNYVFEEKENHILKDALRWLDIYICGAGRTLRLSTRIRWRLSSVIS